MSVPGTIFQPNSPTDWSTGLVYKGPSSAGLHLQSEYSLTTDEFGATTLTRKWKNERKNNIAQFLPQKGNVDFQYPQLQVFDYAIDAEGPYETLSVKYNGFLSKPGAPLVRESTARQVREATVYAITNTPVQISFGSLTIQYDAPTRTRRWAQPNAPKLQDPYSVDDFNEPILRLMFKSPQGFELKGDTIDFLSQFFRYKEVPLRMDFQVDHEGAVYRITEVCEMAIIQEAHVNLGKLEAFGFR